MRNKKWMLVAILAVVLALAIAGGAYALTTARGSDGPNDSTAATVGAPSGREACPLPNDDGAGVRDSRSRSGD